MVSARRAIRACISQHGHAVAQEAMPRRAASSSATRSD
ncbi:hypothetical protein [Caudoviricetes sp.]|nr:hypothetical protein [Caudoviricetes sp.]